MLAGACGGSGNAHTTDPSLPKVSSTTTSTTISYAVPATIDLAYVNKVMKALDHVYGDAIRHLAQVKSMDVEFVKLLDSIYTPEESTAQQEGWSLDQQKHQFTDLAATPGDPTTVATRVIPSPAACLAVAVDRSFGPAFKDPAAPRANRYVVLVRSQSQVSHVNPTPWRMSFDGFVKDGGELTDPCA
jgi:hypothetical protein